MKFSDRNICFLKFRLKICWLILLLDSIDSSVYFENHNISYQLSSRLISYLDTTLIMTHQRFDTILSLTMSLLNFLRVLWVYESMSLRWVIESVKSLSLLSNTITLQSNMLLMHLRTTWNTILFFNFFFFFFIKISSLKISIFLIECFSIFSEFEFLLTNDQEHYIALYWGTLTLVLYYSFHCCPSIDPHWIGLHWIGPRLIGPHSVSPWVI